MSQLINYESHLSLNYPESDILALHLFHFVQVFPSVTFTVNNVSVSGISNHNQDDFHKIINENAKNTFEITVSGDNEQDILHLIRILDYSLVDFPYKLSFARV